MIKIYYGNNLTVTGLTKRYNGDPAEQSSPYPKLEISHNIVTSNVSQNSVIFSDTMDGTNGLEGQRVITLSSSIFSPNVSQYQFKIVGDIADEEYFSTIDVANYNNLLLVSGIQTSFSLTAQQSQNFYRQKLKGFFPIAEQVLMEENPKYSLFIESIGDFLDKMDQAIENIITLTRVDEVPDEYIKYLAQVVGYETDDFTITNIALKSIVQEIFAIYNLRGTHAGFEQFFKALGYDATIVEKWYVGEYRVLSERPHVDLVGSSINDAWKYSTLYGSEVGGYGALDLIMKENTDYAFAELYPSAVYSYNLDPSTRYQANKLYSKSERLINIFVEPLKELTLVPDIINQMLVYIEFLKPIHLKLVLTLLKQFGENENWWEEKTFYGEEIEQVEEIVNDSSIFYDLEIDGSKQTLGNVPRYGNYMRDMTIHRVNDNIIIGPKPRELSRDIGNSPVANTLPPTLSRISAKAEYYRGMDDIQFTVGMKDELVGNDTPTEFNNGPWSKIYASGLVTSSKIITRGTRSSLEENEYRSTYKIDMRWDSSPSASQYFFNGLTFNGDFTIHETDFSDYRFDSAIWEPYGDGGSVILKRVSHPTAVPSSPRNFYYLNQSTIASTIITLNEQFEEYDLSILLGYYP